MTRYAIIMTVENYKSFTPTKFTHADGDLLYQTLTKKCDYPEQHTMFLKLSPEVPMAPAEIISEIKKTVSNSSSGDSILFYFAGHGHYADEKTYLILPNTVPGAYETTSLSLDDISNELRVRERACFRLFDACHSGLDVRAENGELNSQDFIRSINHDASGWVTIAACREDQFSISDSKIGHGLFTYYLCDEISTSNTDVPIYPEILKVKITDKVLEHSRKLGYTQTPTINASISGNISLAIRRVDAIPTENEKERAHEDLTRNLELRIAALKEVRDVLNKGSLDQVLTVITERCLAEFNRNNSLNFSIALGAKISADHIPENMHSYIVKFARKLSLQPRHRLERIEEEYEDPYSYIGALAALYPRRTRKRVSYYISQPADLPPSAVIMDLKGDGRCLPNIKVLIYLIPLQITGCILVSVFNCGWQNDDQDFDLIKNYYQILRPNDNDERVEKIGPFAAKGAFEEITNIVQKRVDLLDRELNG